MADKRAINGSGRHLNEGGRPSDVQGHAHFAGTFDIDDGSFKTRPKTLLTIMAGLFLVGGICALVLYRVNSIENTLAELPGVIESKITASQEAADQQRKIDCLQQQIANKNWTCPYAVQAAKEPEPIKRRAPVVAAKKVDADTGFSFWGPATAKGTK